MYWRAELVGRTLDYLRINHPAPVQNPWLPSFCARGCYFYRASWHERFPEAAIGRARFHIYFDVYGNTRQDIVCSARLESVAIDPALPIAIQGVFGAVAPGRHRGEGRALTRDVDRVLINVPPLFNPQLFTNLLPLPVWNSFVTSFLMQPNVQIILNEP